MLPIMTCARLNKFINLEINNEKVFVGIIASDAVIMIASLALGILGLCSLVSGMSEAASYALIGVGVAICLSYIGLIVYMVKHPEYGKIGY